MRQATTDKTSVAYRLGIARNLVRKCKVTTLQPRTTGAVTKDDVMLGLRSQSGPDTDHWSVVGGNSTSEGQLLATHIDEASLQKLRSLGIDTAVTEEHLQTGDGSIRILFASVRLPDDSVVAPPITAMRRAIEYGVNRG
nr:unnamed protein product [Callosobruchus analis]